MKRDLFSPPLSHKYQINFFLSHTAVFQFAFRRNFTCFTQGLFLSLCYLTEKAILITETYLLKAGQFFLKIFLTLFNETQIIGNNIEIFSY